MRSRQFKLKTALCRLFVTPRASYSGRPAKLRIRTWRDEQLAEQPLRLGHALRPE